MARNLHADTVAAVQRGTVRPIHLVALAFRSGTMRVHTDVGDIAWGGQTWRGVGDLGAVGPVEESVYLRAPVVELTLAGIPTDGTLAAVVADETEYIEREAVIYWALRDLVTGAIVRDPDEWFRGWMDSFAVVSRPNNAAIVGTLESELIEWERPSGLVYSDSTQRREFPGDRGLEYVEAQRDVRLKWGPSG